MTASAAVENKHMHDREELAQGSASEHGVAVVR